MKISVIIPVYNTEKYLRKCLDSVIKQTNENFEMIIVDDGSTDNSLEICKAYEMNYDFIKVITKENGGLSDARNYGIRAASGEYITFLDSDDTISDDYIDNFITIIEKYNADLVIVGIYRHYENERISTRKEPKIMVMKPLEALEDMLYQKNITNSANALAVKRNIATKHLFPKGKNFEDALTTYKYYMDSQIIVVDTDYKYYYLQRHGSIMHTFKRSNLLNEKEAADNFLDICLDRYPMLIGAGESKKFSMYCHMLLTYRDLKEREPRIYNELYSYVMDVKYRLINDSRVRIKNRVVAGLLIFGLDILKCVDSILKFIQKKV